MIALTRYERDTFVIYGVRALHADTIDEIEATIARGIDAVLTCEDEVVSRITPRIDGSDVHADIADAQIAAVLEVLIERRHEPPSEELARAVLEAAANALIAQARQRVAMARGTSR